jgi:hypothetical protein
MTDSKIGCYSHPKLLGSQARGKGQAGLEGHNLKILKEKFSMTRKSMTLALCFSLATVTFSSAAFAKGPRGDRGRQSGNARMTIPSRGESQRGDDRGGLNRHPEPGDDRGGINRHPEPGDDRGGLNKHPESRDDRGGINKHPEPGDDRGRRNR